MNAILLSDWTQLNPTNWISQKKPVSPVLSEGN